MFGIIGYPLLQTFSPGYFNKKFEALGLNETYVKFPITSIDQLHSILQQHPDLKGLNVTIPYKQEVISLLDEIDDTAKEIAAVNTIAIKNGRLTGYNTDVTGFKNSLEPLLAHNITKALILGTGGASKAIAFALKTLDISFKFVSRNKEPDQYTYAELTREIINDHQLIINTTPLGMPPLERSFPDIPYTSLASKHLLYDLIYYPEETPFLQKGKAQGARIKNGYEMLIGQAEAAWRIWQEQ
jgi:shikimate dehydrogenase